eukprot:scaffold22559_cov111-Cylindrotheca_fusiformis.AAC.7
MIETPQHSTRPHQVTQFAEISEIRSSDTFSSSYESFSHQDYSHNQLQGELGIARQLFSTIGDSTSLRREPFRPYLFVKHLFQFCLIVLMNAAIAIFGIGVGVGMILADSFRSQDSLFSAPTSPSSSNSSSDGSFNRRSEATVTVSVATPSCRTTIRRTMDRIQEAPPLSVAAALKLPAQ